MEETTTNKRREFLKKALAASAAAALTPQLLNATSNGQKYTKIGDGFTFLFQGDSITDGNRTRNNDWNHVMGHGYQYIIASKLWYDFPKKGFKIFNRGISGNKVTDLTARWQQDTLDLKPDVLSVLIGINDVAAFVAGNKDFSVEQYENGYRSLLQQTRQQLPDIQMVLCEPFILLVGKLKAKWEDYSTEVKKRQAVVQRLSEEHNAVFVPFQSAFDKALSKAPADYWIWDGVHPMPAGHELMAREWMHHVSKRIRFIK
ncbi:lysophospholipase [Segetibacter sp. 3557_3]|uniref:SGNH/GDSL hydrolase family protein n=1 Tax=Segetibacter sp. 3557_3 TaxID=2547429 RepID=UPI0010591EB3|nr:SGNH/GDSL hydrolase family protein [Segetibacter sp. 3557_3]TDH23446.1 lysophospholipase [Segetibacter sp. 3557_3]